MLDIKVDVNSFLDIFWMEKNVDGLTVEIKPGVNYLTPKAQGEGELGRRKAKSSQFKIQLVFHITWEGHKMGR